MPIIPTPESPKTSGGASDLGPYAYIDYSDMGGLTQFGAFIEELPPGSKSSYLHWHQTEDEFIYMLSGEVTLREGDSETPFRAGQCATFKAGQPIGHCLENRTEQTARYLVVGTRAASDIITYPDYDRVCHFDRTNRTRRWETLDGKPKNSLTD